MLKKTECNIRVCHSSNSAIQNNNDKEYLKWFINKNNKIPYKVELNAKIQTHTVYVDSPDSWG